MTSLGSLVVKCPGCCTDVMGSIPRHLWQETFGARAALVALLSKIYWTCLSYTASVPDSTEKSYTKVMDCLLFNLVFVNMGDLHLVLHVSPRCWHFDNGATWKIDDVLIEHGGLPHILPLAVPGIFFPGEAEGTILRHSYPLSFFGVPFSSCLKVVGGGLQDLSVSPCPLGTNWVLDPIGIRVWGQASKQGHEYTQRAREEVKGFTA